MVDGAAHRVIVLVGSEKFGIQSGPAGDDHADRRQLSLGDGVGGERGTQDDAFHIVGPNAQSHRFQAPPHTEEQIIVGRGNFRLTFNAVFSQQDHIGVRAAHIQSYDHDRPRSFYGFADVA